MRPGVTGWAQVNGRKSVDWNRRIEFDVEYVDGLSAAFDVRIFVQNLQRQVFGNETGWRRLGKLEVDAVAGAQLHP